MRVLVIQHDHVSPPGAVGERFADRGYEVVLHPVVAAEHFLNPGVSTAVPERDDVDAIVPMGAPWSVYDHELIGAWVEPELRLLAQAHRTGVPVLGICFGGQLLALAHGGAVQRSATPELGWTMVESQDESLIPRGPWFQWHLDGWTLPPGATELARNPRSSQAFRIGRNLAVQFHPELDSSMLAGWLANGGHAAMEAFGASPELVMQQTRQRDADARRRAHALVDAFLDRIASG